MAENVRQRRPLELDNSDISKRFNDKEQQTQSTTQTHLENFFWFTASTLSIYYSDIINVILYEKLIFRSILMVSFAFIFVNISIAFYLIVWLSLIKQINSNKWNDLHPRLIPIATGSFVIGFLLLSIAIWPYYTWMTLPLLFVIFMGFIVVLISMPSFF